MQGRAVAGSTPHSPHSSEKEPAALNSNASILHWQSDQDEYELVRFQGPNGKEQADLHEDQYTSSARALLYVKKVIEQMKAIKQMPLTQREREVLDESLERAYDRAAFLLTPQVMQMLVDDEAATEREDADVSRVSFP